MITTIIFDLSEVLIKGLLGSERHLHKYSNKIKVTDFFIIELDNFFLGKISEDEYWQAVLKKNMWDLSINDLKDAVRKNFQEIKGTRKIVENLNKNGYKLALLSNHAREWVEFCEKTYKYHRLFKHITYSFEISISKPNKKAYITLLDKIRAKPYECLFIDDNLANVKAAEDLRIKTIHFVSPKSLKEKLRGLNLI